MDIKIFSSYREQDNFIIYWQQCPDYFINWLVNNFTAGELNNKKHKLDFSKPIFKDFLRFLDSKPNVFSTARFFGVKSESLADSSPEEFFYYLGLDIDRMIDRKMIGMIENKTTHEEKLTGFVKFQIGEEISNMPEPICKQGIFTVQVIPCEKQFIDHGYGETKRYLHESEYFLNLSIRIYGVPLEEDEVVLDIRPEFLKAYDCQRVSPKQLKIFEDKNNGKKIAIALRYLESADGWKFGFTVVDKKQIIGQLEF